jgi:hypothetical protein
LLVPGEEPRFAGSTLPGVTCHLLTAGAAGTALSGPAPGVAAERVQGGRQPAAQRSYTLDAPSLAYIIAGATAVTVRRAKRWLDVENRPKDEIAVLRKLTST